MSEFPPVPGDNRGHNGIAGETSDSFLQAAMLDAVSEALSAAFLVYDRNDQLIFASRAVRNFVPAPSSFFAPGTRLRDFLAAAYDNGWRDQGENAAQSRDEWLSRQISAHWKERSELQLCNDARRWTRYSKRRLPSGYGICVITDITEQKKREDQWRADLERVQLTEEILDNLAHPVFVQDRSLHLVAVNKVFCAAMAVGADSALGGSLDAIFEADLATALTNVSRHVLDTGMSSSVTLNMRLYGDPSRPILTHVQRVGKPGRYFVVASLGEVGSMATTVDIGVGQTGGAFTNPSPVLDPKPDQRLRGRKALLVTSDRDFEAAALHTLEVLGLDSCCVRNDDELDAFLNVALSVGVAIDLAIVDVQMDVRCLELIQTGDVDYVTMDGYQLSTELAFTVLDRLTALQAAPSPVDDWEISTEESVEPARPPISPSLVLVAEDNEINQIVFAQILEGLGYAYRIAATGEEVVRLWQELAPAIILMDVTLPDINGFDAARRIRELEHATLITTPIIGVLSQAFERDREGCYSAGMNDVILKPLSPDIIDAALTRLAPSIAKAASLA
ncbi:response regulator [Rhizobium sp. 18065]|uniref:response regulator n=1 Tax=Rhizobium sp. 18065 TaxID=2681411 RepID=UPI00135C065B|nr:response regulator [Rhizobium sp. 18065]